MTTPMYRPARPAQSNHALLRHIDMHWWTWGTPQQGQAPLVLLHGWMDVGASFQFVVDALPHDRWVLALDWRGFGGTWAREPVESYWFPDYLADLDVWLDHCVGDQAVDLVGHSMGGNLAMHFAGLRPQRVRRLVNLEGFGLPTSRPAQAPGRMSQWLDELKALRQGERTLRTYPNVEAVAQRLQHTNPRLPVDKALWLAQHWAQADEQGQWHVLGDAAHKIINPWLYRVDEVLAIWARITAPLLAVEAQETTIFDLWPSSYSLAEYHERLRTVPQCQTVVVPQAGHMLHHDQPALVAQHIAAHCAPF